MPCGYAHYRFGQRIRSALSGSAEKAVRRCPLLFNMGLHGPDVFFYYNPLMHTRTGEIGMQYHRMTGQEFFGGALEQYRQNPSEGALSYLCGVLAHYTLDSACHGFVNASAETAGADHLEIESEFDRFLLELDGKVPPCTYDLSPYLRLTRGGCITLSEFYPPASAFAVGLCVRHMGLIHRALSHSDQPRVRRMIRLAGKNAAQMLLPLEPNPKCNALDEPLLALFGEAEARYPLLLEELMAAVDSGTPLSDAFQPTFIG